MEYERSHAANVGVFMHITYTTWMLVIASQSQVPLLRVGTQFQEAGESCFRMLAKMGGMGVQCAC